jgi:hypothetical protein
MTVHDASDVVPNDVAVADHTVLRRLVLLGTPLALALLEIFHPEQPSGASEAVEQGGGSCGSISSRFPSSAS